MPTPLNINVILEDNHPDHRVVMAERRGRGCAIFYLVQVNFRALGKNPARSGNSYRFNPKRGNLMESETGPVKILVMDDDPESRSTLRQELRTIHYDVITAESVEEGIQLAATIQPDLVLLDATTKQLGGVAVIEQLRGNHVIHPIPVIFLVAQYDVDNIFVGLDPRYVDYVVRPYTPKELQARIHKALNLHDEQKEFFDKFHQIEKSLVRMVTHNLGTPISVIACFAELLVRKLPRLEQSVQVAYYLQQIIERTNFVNDVVDDFLYLLQPRPGCEEVNLVRLVQAASDKFHRAIEEKGQKIVLKLPEQANLMIRANGHHLFKAVKHLISNAHKFTGTGGTITIAIIFIDQGVRVEVMDTGIGIPASQQRLIFEKYYQQQEELASSHLGMGLGLTIVRSVAEQHHGSVGVKSRPGQGSRFWIDLPLIHHASGPI